MRNDHYRLSLAVAAAGFALASGTAAAQQTPSTSEIIVEAPHLERTTERGPQGGPIEIIAVTHHVSYRDIDIGTNSGAQVLEQRIKNAAKAACQEIDKLYPLKVPVASDPPCEKGAVDKAMVQARAAIAAAEKAHK
jgi:UrcA family protein